jgi:hypothetical protein
MTDPGGTEETRDIVNRLAGADRSAAFAIHAILTEAADTGFAPVNRVAIRFRDDFLDSLRARGEDATREAGRLSLDEVRAFLDNSVLPRLTSTGVITWPEPSPATGEPGVRVKTDVWAGVAGIRGEVAERFRALEVATIPPRWPGPPSLPKKGASSTPKGSASRIVGAG